MLGFEPGAVDMRGAVGCSAIATALIEKHKVAVMAINLSRIRSPR